MRRTNWQRAAFACAAALALGALSQSAQAQMSKSVQSTLRKHCSADFREQCRGVRPGGTKALACLEEHIEHLSQPCQDAVFSLMPAGRTVDVPDPGGSAAKSESAASPPAPEESAAKRAVESLAPPPSAAQKRALRRHCAQDFRKDCAGIQAGSPDALACLQGNLPRLSRSCQRAVSATMTREQIAIVSTPPQAAPAQNNDEKPADAAAPAQPADAAAPPAEREASAANRQADAPAASAEADTPAPRAESDAAPAHAETDQPQSARAEPDAQPPRAELDAAPDRGERDGRPSRAEVDATPPAELDETPAPVERHSRRAEREVALPRHARALRACESDFAAHCPSLSPGSGGAVACLRRHASSLIPSCRRALRKATSRSRPRHSHDSVTWDEDSPRHHRHAYRPTSRMATLERACRSEFNGHCRYAREGRALACLAAHKRSLSLPCQIALWAVE
jgi:hypothetical protein